MSLLTHTSMFASVTPGLTDLTDLTDASGNLTSPTEDPINCEDKMIEDGVYVLVMSMTAIVYFGILMATETRTTPCDGCDRTMRCKGCDRTMRCKGFGRTGRFGILMSVNFLENKTNRSMVVVAFILTTLDVMDAMFQMDDNKEITQYQILKVIVRIALVCVLCFIYLPLFHCISVHTLLRQCLGLIYVWLLVPLRLLSSTTVCHYIDLTPDLLSKEGAEGIIIITAGSFLTIVFIYRIIVMIKTTYLNLPVEDNKEDPYQIRYIKNLLQKPSKSTEVGISSRVEKTIRRLRKYLYKNIPGFRYSISILISVVLGVLLYILMISSVVGEALDLYLSGWKFVETNRYLLNDTIPNFIVDIAKLLASNSDDIPLTDSMTVAVFLETQLNCIFGSFCLAASLAAFQVCSTVFYMLKGYRKNVLSMYRQELDDNVMEGVDNVALVVNAMQFGGYQVAHMIWGYILQLVVFFILFLLFTEGIVFPVLYNYWGVIKALVSWLGPIVGVKLLSRFLQTLLVRRAFLVNSGRVFGIDNRKGFFNMMFFMFFYNIFSGLVSCALRVIKVLVIGVWFFPRLDRSIFPHSFEKYDAGYKAYVCLLKLEERQNNVILLCFIHLLTEKCCTPESKKDACVMERQSSLEQNYIWKRSPRNRWFLAWTLIHNENLRTERRGTKFEAPFTKSTDI